MAAAGVMSLGQMPEANMQPMLVQQMVPCYYVAQAEFCDGMWVTSPIGGCEAMWPQGMVPQDDQNGYMPGSNCNGGNIGVPPDGTCFNAAPQVWLQQSNPQGFGGPVYAQPPPLSNEPVTVELNSLPDMLRNRMCLEASIEQAGLESLVQSIDMDGGRSGKALLVMANESAAKQCIRHFDGLRWAKSATAVTARLASQVDPIAAAPKQKEKAQPNETKRKDTVKASKNTDSRKHRTMSSDSSSSVKDAKKHNPDLSPPSTPLSKASTACSTPVSTCASPPHAPKARPRRWSDWADEEDDDEGMSLSTLSGNPGDATGTSESDESSLIAER